MAQSSQTPGTPRVMPLHEAPLAPVKAVDPLYVPRPSDAWVPRLNSARQLARGDLAEQQTANIHDHQAMIRAAVKLEIRLRQVLAALDAEVPA